ncbi:MAG: FMN-dependent NADH-azoreductase [Candidatus Tokpelaia hoelldobleri]|uniref:FMN dependent NADH:quinone oxidoreductase n=1 Tax=Candidatus Tokpelaia hoelldobleri TaxID=1902579 RepID=A0A1U9JSQ1_9HYPH|nr:MAG: FMN-dependent NADH-azoreductase [Candidatus Tokpelaia hoelldoblerii]
MSKLLVLKSSIMGENSTTNALIDRYLDHRKANGCEDEIVEHDLTTMNLPVLDGEIFAALRGAENPSQRAKDAIAFSDKLIAELKAADLVVIGAPMYNLNVPTHLKLWFDMVARARETFRYTETYPLGLVEGVDAVVISTRGGIHLGAETDVVTPYLRSVLGLMGITNVDFIYGEGFDIQPHGKRDGIADAHAQIAKRKA